MRGACIRRRRELCRDSRLTLPFPSNVFPERPELYPERVVTNEAGRHSVFHLFLLRLVGAETGGPIQ